jgi:hypothetical protein
MPVPPFILLRRSTLPLLLLILFSLQLAGCAGAAASIAVDAAGPAIEKTAELINSGKFEAYEPASFDEAVASVRTAADHLDLRYVREERCKDRLKLVYYDQRKQKIDITLTPRTPRVTSILVEVGWFGAKGMGRLTMRQILHDLPQKLVIDHSALQEGGG